MFEALSEKSEAECRYCGYLGEYIEEGLCYDIQMICAGYIKPSALEEYVLGDDTLKHCAECLYKTV